MANDFPSNLVETRLMAIEASQTAMNGALTAMLSALEVQTNLLRELTNFTREEPGPSPLVKTLRNLTSASERMDVSFELMGQKFDSCGEAIAIAMGMSLKELLAWGGKDDPR